MDFYVLAAADAAARAHFACRLAEKVYQLRQRVHLHAGSVQEAAALDELLWTFRQGSFVPHEVARPGEPVQSPVTIGCDATMPQDVELLINLASDVPEFAAQAPRVAEIVDASPEGRRAGRERFRHHREAGRQPETHEIGSA